MKKQLSLLLDRPSKTYWQRRGAETMRPSTPCYSSTQITRFLERSCLLAWGRI